MGAVLKPIPRSLLHDAITVRRPIDGEYGGEYGEPEEITPVRFQDAEAVSRNGYRLEDGARGLLFIDAKNSKGSFQIPTGSIIEVRGESMTAMRTVALEGYHGEVHHWEVEVG